jgi:thioredoxin-related protein
MIALVLALALAVLAGETAPNQPDGKPQKADSSQITWYPYDQGLTLAKKLDRHVLIDFTTDWCGWCKKMEQTTFADNEVISLINSEFVAVRVDGESKDTLNIDGYKITEKDLTVGEYGVRSYPSFWFLKSDGSRLGLLRGYQQKNQMMEILQFVAEYKYDTTGEHTQKN